MSEADIASALAAGAATCIAFGDVIHQKTATPGQGGDLASWIFR